MIFLSLFVFEPLAAAQNRPGNLAAVAVVPMEDKTGGDRFGYMSESLADAMDRSMQEQFTYNAIPRDVVKRALSRLNAKDKSQKDMMTMLAREVEADIVIFGDFHYNNFLDVLVINISVYYASGNRTAVLEPVTSKVDNTLFAATDVAAGKIVKEIHTLVLARQEERRIALGLESPPEEAAGDQKLKIISNRRNKAQLELEALVDEGVERHFKEIQAGAARLPLYEREEIYLDQYNKPFVPFLLNTVVGWGVGSFIQGDTLFGFLGLGMDVLSAASIVTSSIVGWSTVIPFTMIGMYGAIISRLMQMTVPWFYAGNYNQKLKTALLLDGGVQAWVAPDEQGDPVYGARVVHRF